MSVIDLIKEMKPGFDIDPSTDLIATGLIDSFDIIYLVNSLEESYSIVIPIEEILPENFTCTESIHRLIQKCSKNTDSVN